VLSYSEIQWNYRGLSSNPNLTFDFFKSHAIEAWETFNLSMNYFNYAGLFENTTWRTKYKKCIEEELMRVTWHPKRAFDWCYDTDRKKLLNDLFR